MRLTAVRATNWQAYPSFEIDFTVADEFVITGQNNHGKSAIPDAITYALWGRIGRPVDQRVSDRWIRSGADAMAVTVEFDTSDGHNVAVTREKAAGKTGTLGLTVDGARQTHHTVVETQAAITRLVGLDYDAITASSFMVQGRSDSFMAADPRQRKDLLIGLLGLERYEVLHGIANRSLLEAEADERAADRRLAELEDVLANEDVLRIEKERADDARDAASTAREAAEEARTQAAAALAAATARAEAAEAGRIRARDAMAALQTARAKAAGWRQSLGQAELTREREAEPLAPPAVAPVPVPVEAIAVEEAAITAALEARAELFDIDAKRARWQERVTEADRQLAILPTVPCHGEGEYAACRFLTDIPPREKVDEARAKVAEWELQTTELAGVAVTLGEHEATLKALRAQAQQALDAERAQDRYEAALTLWRERMANHDRTIADATERIAEAEADAERLSKAYDAALAEATAALQAEADLTAMQAESTRAHDAWRAAAEVSRQADAAAVAATTAWAVAYEIVKEAPKLRATAQDARERAEVLRILVGAWHRDGIPTTIIETVVPVIEERANEVLARFPQSLTLQLRTQKPVNKGAGMVETLDVIVTMYGYEREYGLLSVGARLRVDLAIRMALGELLSHRTGRSVRTLFLDEPLASLDRAGKEAVIETLHAVRRDFGLAVVISHDVEFNDAFEANVAVDQVEGISTLEVIAA